MKTQLKVIFTAALAVALTASQTLADTAPAGTNAAAINYHFGGIEGLYAAVLCEAHRRLISLD